jgi:phosphate transport system permease protein
MTDATITDFTTAKVDWTGDAARERVRKRRGGDLRLKIAGLAALCIALGMLAILMLSLISTGWQALTQTHVRVTYDISAEHVDPANPQGGNYRAIVAEAVAEIFPDLSRSEMRDAAAIISSGAQNELRALTLANPALVGTRVTLNVPVSDPYDQLNKGLIDRQTPEANRRLKDGQIALFDRLVEQGVISKPLNWGLLTRADSRFPELAGLQGAIWGSIYVLGVCFLFSFPTGIAAGVYLEEFAPKNRFTDIIEVNINNLAAVPSVVFGLLALAVFIGWLGMPRSAPFVGGLTLALMTLPTIIIATARPRSASAPQGTRWCCIMCCRWPCPGS